MKKFFTQDKTAVGIVAGLGSELLFCLLLTAVLLIIGEPIDAHIRWFGGMFIPILLILRAYAKQRTYLKVTKTLIIVFFLTFVTFMFCLLKFNILSLK
ncbi:MAG: hypothetical protein J6W88_04305 [Bacteroidales bacterium]|nr:hypothetical protein [Bacteroidales bacterium]